MEMSNGNVVQAKNSTYLPVMNAKALREVAENLPELPKLLDPILAASQLGMIYAATGVGKTFFAVEIAVAVATGGECFGWKAPMPRKVLYIDGEMGTRALSERIDSARKRMPHLDEPDNLKILPYDACVREGVQIPDMSISSELSRLDQYTQDMYLIIVDNLSALLRSGIENEAESWREFQGWLLRMRAEGCAVLLIHHAGKSGSQRGTSKRLDALDLTIKLSKVDGHDGSVGAWFKVEFEKSRGLFGEAVRPFSTQLIEGEWKCDSAGSSPLQLVADTYNSGTQSPTEIGKILGKDKSTISRQIKDCKENGLIPE